MSLSDKECCHRLDARFDACNDGACPQCLSQSLAEAEAKIKELEVKLAEATAKIHTLQTDGGIWDKSVYKARADAAQSTIAQMAEALEHIKTMSCKGCSQVAKEALALPLVVSILERQKEKK